MGRSEQRGGRTSGDRVAPVKGIDSCDMAGDYLVNACNLSERYLWPRAVVLSQRGSSCLVSRSCQQQQDETIQAQAKAVISVLMMQGCTQYRELVSQREFER